MTSRLSVRRDGRGETLKIPTINVFSVNSEAPFLVLK